MVAINLLLSSGFDLSFLEGVPFTLSFSRFIHWASFLQKDHEVLAFFIQATLLVIRVISLMSAIFYRIFVAEALVSSGFDLSIVVIRTTLSFSRFIHWASFFNRGHEVFALLLATRLGCRVILLMSAID
jgi:hypothetical protein